MRGRPSIRKTPKKTSEWFCVFGVFCWFRVAFLWAFVFSTRNLSFLVLAHPCLFDFWSCRAWFQAGRFWFYCGCSFCCIDHNWPFVFRSWSCQLISSQCLTKLDNQCFCCYFCCVVYPTSLLLRRVRSVLPCCVVFWNFILIWCCVSQEKRHCLHSGRRLQSLQRVHAGAFLSFWGFGRVLSCCFCFGLLCAVVLVCQHYFAACLRNILVLLCAHDWLRVCVCRLWILTRTNTTKNGTLDARFSLLLTFSLLLVALVVSTCEMLLGCRRCDKNRFDPTNASHNWSSVCFVSQSLFAFLSCRKTTPHWSVIVCAQANTEMEARTQGSLLPSVCNHAGVCLSASLLVCMCMYVFVCVIDVFVVCSVNLY